MLLDVARSYWPSTPAAPRFAFTRSHASREDVTPRRCGRTARGSVYPDAAWPHPTADVAVVALCPRGLRPRGSLGPVAAGHSLALTSPPTRPPQGPFPPAALFCAAFVPEQRRSTVRGPLGLPLRSARLRTWLIRPALPRRRPRRRISRVPHFSLHACCAPYPAGAVCALRISRSRCCLRRDMSGSAPGLFLCRGCRLHFMLRPACLLAPRHPFDAPLGRQGSLPLGWGLLPGAPTLTGTGLSPADRERRATPCPYLRGSRAVASRRTIFLSYGARVEHRALIETAANVVVRPAAPPAAQAPGLADDLLRLRPDRDRPACPRQLFRRRQARQRLPGRTTGFNCVPELLCPPRTGWRNLRHHQDLKTGAGEEIRTLDPHVGNRSNGLLGNDL